MNTQKGANGELFIDSISDSAEKSNSFDKNSSKTGEPHPPQAVPLPHAGGRQGGRMALTKKDNRQSTVVPKISKCLFQNYVLVKILHGEFAVFVHHIGAWVVLLRECRRAGI